MFTNAYYPYQGKTRQEEEDEIGGSYKECRHLRISEIVVFEGQIDRGLRGLKDENYSDLDFASNDCLNPREIRLADLAG